MPTRTDGANRRAAIRRPSLRRSCVITYNHMGTHHNADSLMRNAANQVHIAATNQRRRKNSTDTAITAVLGRSAFSMFDSAISGWQARHKRLAMTFAREVGAAA